MQKVLFFSCTFPLPLSHHEIVLVVVHLTRNKCCSYSHRQVLWKNQRTEDCEKNHNLVKCEIQDPERTADQKGL